MDGFDLVVVGPRVHGAGAAFHLARAGARVAVVDARVAAGGPRTDAAFVQTDPFASGRPIAVDYDDNRGLG